MAIKLIALDLDGTLLSSDKTISEANKAALQAAREQGAYIVLTTGRPLQAIGPFLEELDLLGENQYSITFNGGLVQENTGRVLDQIGFSYQDVETIYQLTQDLGLPLDAIRGGDVYSLTAERPSLYPSCNPALNHMTSSFSDLKQEGIFNKAVTATDQDFLDQQIARIPADFYEKFEIFKSRPILLEWSPKGVHKAAGLSKLIAHLGIHQEEVMACGDEGNDLSMIEWAGLGMAMANATDEIKAAANLVLPKTNDQDGIAWAIEKYVLSED